MKETDEWVEKWVPRGCIVGLFVMAAMMAWNFYGICRADDVKEKAEGITMTKQQWEDWAQKRITAALAKEKADTSDQKIVQAENWHTAIFNGVEYTIYTGPGQVMYRRTFSPPPNRPPRPARPGRCRRPEAWRSRKANRIEE